eukprot:Gb_36657 [translate_table: standard]
MDITDAPSFSLGIDFDTQRPSFSLGLDDEDEIPTSYSPSNLQSKPLSESNQIQELNPKRQGFPLQESNSAPVGCRDQDYKDLQCGDEEPLPRLKRLRRGPPANEDDAHVSTLPSTTVNGHHASPQRFELDRIPIDCDDIEDFSSEDDFLRGDNETLRNSSVRPSSSTKLSLYGRRGVITTPSQKPNSAPPLPGIKSLTKLEGSSIRKPVSGEKIGLVRINRRLRDNLSEEEEDEDIVAAKSTVTWDGGSTKAKKDSCGKPVFRNEKIVGEKLLFQDSWKNFTANQGTSLPSPAFDEFCDEYFRDPKESNDFVCNEKPAPVLDSSVPLAYQYFDNDDARIQRLLRQRLPNFLPINVIMRGEDQVAERVQIDYLGQFGGGQGTTPASSRSCGLVNSQRGVENLTKKKLTSKRTGKRKKGAQDNSGTSNWVNPRSQNSQSIPRDAGKRRVCAEGSSTGSWFTDHTGKKVYISKDGREMTGRAAYLQHKKENGIRFRKTNKKFRKRAAKKK